MKQRLDQMVVVLGLVPTRSQAENMVRLGKVMVDGQAITKPGYFVRSDAAIRLKAEEQYVSRAGLKLASVATALKLQFTDKVVLDVGSSTGGFTDFALRHGAAKVIAVDVGTEQLHPSLRANPAIELYEQTDIRNVVAEQTKTNPLVPEAVRLSAVPDIVLIDASFISLRDILSHIATLCGARTLIVAMLKPQFEAGPTVKHKGVIKNDALRRAILKDFETWARQQFVVVDKADSEVAGARGNRERFYALRLARR